MAKAKQELSWNTIDPASLPSEIQALHAAYRAAYKAHAESATALAMKAAKQAFEDALQPAAPDGKRMVFNYNFGKLSIALADVEAAKPPKGAVTFSQLIARRA